MEAQITFVNAGASRCLLDHLRFDDDVWTVALSPPQVVVEAGASQTVRAHAAGPTPPAATLWYSISGVTNDFESVILSP